MALSGSLTKSPSQNNVVGQWHVPLCDGVHSVEFEHGSTSGKRVLRIDGEEILRRDWMFKLVGDEKFTVGVNNPVKCELRVDPQPHFTFSYALYVDGKPYEQFIEKQQQCLRSWSVRANEKTFEIVFDKQTLNVWLNGEHIEVESAFVPCGTEMRFQLPESDAAAVLRSSADSKLGIVHHLFVNDVRIEEHSELPDWKK